MKSENNTISNSFIQVKIEYVYQIPSCHSKSLDDI